MNRTAACLKGQAHQRVQAVAVFELGQGSQTCTAAPLAFAALRPRACPLPSTERRAPNRAKNVTRPKFGEAKPELATLGAEA